MKKFITRLSIILIAALFTYTIVIIGVGLTEIKLLDKNVPGTFGDHNNTFTYTRLKEAEKKQKADLVVFGSSLAYRGYDPRIFKEAGYDLFNLGTSAQTPLQTEYIVKKYYSQYKPKLVILDVNPFLLRNEGIEPTIDIISNSNTMDAKMMKLLFKIKDIRTMNAFIYSNFRWWFGLNKDFKQNLIAKNGDQYIGNGYVESQRTYSSPNHDFKETFGLYPLQVKALRNIVTFLKEKKVKYILVESPILKARYAQSKDLNKDSLFKSLGPFIDINKQITVPDSCFADDSHLNQKGVNIFNHKLIEVLKPIMESI